MKLLYLILFFLLSFPSLANEEYSTITVSGSSTVYIIGWIGPVMKDYILSLDPKKVKRIQLNSEGGKLRQALVIATYVRRNNIETYVSEDGRCYSACTVIFQAGTKRIAHKTAMFMYHYAYIREGQNNEISVGSTFWTRIMCNALVDYGMFKELVDLILPDADLYLTAEQAMQYGVVTTVED